MSKNQNLNSKDIKRRSISVKDMMDEYDNSSPECRKLMANAPYKIKIQNPNVYETNMSKILQKEILATYGPTHPQYVGS